MSQAVHPAALDDETLLKSCRVERGRTSGPGGQHRNKVETAVFITHLPTGIQGQASERRRQDENRRKAVRRLRHALAVHVRCAVPVGDARSDLWKSRCRKGQLAINPKHRDYPALLAEALDVLASIGWDPKKAAVRLDVTPSQLIKLVKLHAPAFELWNKMRLSSHQHGLH
ncbi:MAG: peptide chain release factor-like protein [Phycisphaerales bacterium]|nr:peptide chain release factor-like protein [Phycisphaerales bacterium]